MVEEAVVDGMQEMVVEEAVEVIVEAEGVVEVIVEVAEVVFFF